MLIEDYKDRCTGCGVCEFNCPVNAIAMVKDELGFNYPHIDTCKCINCHKCEKCCPLNEGQVLDQGRKAYYGWSTDENIRFNSSSGGIFAAIARSIIDEGGVVYGACYDAEKRIVRHDSTDNFALEDIMKSKYVESNFNGILSSIQNELNKGRKVFLCGTPCQIAGARKVFGNIDKLLLVDFICHGVPAPHYLTMHLNHIEKRYKVIPNNISFRNKDKGWDKFGLKVFNKESMYYYSLSLDEFYSAFINNIMLRKSCYDCNYRDNRFADITIADFWGYNKVEGLNNDEKGISLIVTHTPKGDSIVNNLTNFELHKLDYKYAAYAFNRKPISEKLKQRSEFIKLVEKKGFEKAANKMCTDSLLQRVKNKIKKLIHYS